MADEANNPDDPTALAALRHHADALADALVAALPGWVERSVQARMEDWTGAPPAAGVVADARAAGLRAVEDVEPRLRSLLSADVDVQRSTPLALVREAVRYPTEVLRAAGVPSVVRDAQAERLFPDDLYDLAPATFGDLHPSVHEPGITWGAAKAFVVVARRR